jgi:hypothetical protein
MKAARFYMSLDIPALKCRGPKVHIKLDFSPKPKTFGLKSNIFVGFLTPSLKAGVIHKSFLLTNNRKLSLLTSTSK